MPRKKTFEEVKELFEKRNYILLETTYINNKTHMKYICQKHSEKVQKIRVDSLSNGKGCKYCGVEYVASKKRLNFDKVNTTFRDYEYELLETEYKNNRKLMKYKCKKHPDKINLITFSDLQQGHGCPYCGGTKKLDFHEVKKRFEDNNYTLLETEYNGNLKPMKCYCNNHPDKIQYTTANKFKQGYGCPYCARLKPDNKNNLAKKFPKLLIEWNYDKNKLYPSEYTPFSNKEVWWKCNEGHEWKAQISSRTNKNSGCPICNESKGEKRIREWVENYKYAFIPQMEFKCLVGLGGRQLSYDFYLPDQNLLIEYQGEFHDGVGSEYTKKNLERQQEHDKRKKEYAQLHGIRLLEIWYWDFDNIEKILEKELSNLITQQYNR